LQDAEVTKLAVAITKCPPEDTNACKLELQQFVDWIGLAAQHAYRLEEMRPDTKVEKLVDVIRANASPAVVGSWSKPHYKEAFGIALSNSGPRKVTAFSPEKACRQLGGLQEQVEISTPLGARPLAEKSGHLDELHRIFLYYCGHGAGRPVNSLAGNVLNKMYKDCSVYDRNMKYEHMDIIFLEAAGGRRKNPKLTLSFDQFLVALLKTAAKKYPTEKTAEAFNLLLSQCILPFANREAGEGGQSLRLQPSVANVLASNQQLLELIFAFYTDLDIDPRTSADHLKDAISMSFRELTLWAKDFQLIGTAYCEGISQVRMAKVFQSVCQIMMAEGLTTCDTHIPFEGFQEVVCRCAVQLLSTAYHSATVEERVATLIGKLRAHRSMKPVESWIGRTQTNRVQMYRTKSNGTQHLMNSHLDQNKWTPPTVKNVTPVTRRMTHSAALKAGKTPEPIIFNAEKASNPAMQCCLRGYYG